VNDNGSLGPGPFPAATTTEFEGETNLGCDIAFSAGGGFYFSSFGTNYGISGQLLSREGFMLRGQVTWDRATTRSTATRLIPTETDF